MHGSDAEPGARSESLDLSIIAPAHNEADNMPALAKQIEAALADADLEWELVVVDDGSTDQTRRVVVELARSRSWLRCIAMERTPPGRGNGQSAAFHAGFRAARGSLIATIDADLQNDPADIPGLLAEMQRTGADFVQGDRSASRSEGDAWIRTVGSRVGRAFRRLILADTIRDTGCSLRVMRREIALRLPLEFKGVHRFIPVTARQLGCTVVEVPVAHRARHAGETKYGAGINKRALPGLIDCFAVRWMGARRRPVGAFEATQRHAHQGATEVGTANRPREPVEAAS